MTAAPTDVWKIIFPIFFPACPATKPRGAIVEGWGRPMLGQRGWGQDISGVWECLAWDCWEEGSWGCREVLRRLAVASVCCQGLIALYTGFIGSVLYLGALLSQSTVLSTKISIDYVCIFIYNQSKYNVSISLNIIHYMCLMLCQQIFTSPMVYHP